jgi:hypothetical protein
MAGVQFYEGWAKYGNSGDIARSGTTILPVGDVIQTNGWTIAGFTGSGSVDLVTGPTPTSLGLALTAAGGTGSTLGIRRSITAGNAATTTLGFFFKITSIEAADRVVVQFLDGTTAQCTLAISSTGVLTARSGGVAGTVLGTSASSLSAGVWYFIEATVTINNTTGVFTVDVDTVNKINATSANTRGGTANNYANVYSFIQGGGSSLMQFGPLYERDDTTRVGDVTVETLFVSADSAVQFAFGAMTMGTAYRNSTTTNSPGAGQLALRKYTCPASGSLNSVKILPGATSAGAKFKAVAYADNGSGTAPSGAPLDTGTEVIGTTADTVLNLPMTTPPSLTAGTIYWIGYITDTSVALALTDSGTNGYKASNTYASGAPTSPTMTSGQSSWVIYGNLTGVATNAPEVGVRSPGGDKNYVSSATVNNEDLFTITALTDNPVTIYQAQVWAYTAKTDAGARTIDLRLKSSSTTSSGSSTGQAQSVSYAWQGSKFTTDPNTGSSWTASGINNSKIGYKIAS